MSASRCAEIRHSAIQHNLERIRQLVPSSSVLLMLKANAYGHGAVNVAKALTHVDAFGVATLTEGIELRQAGIQQAIVVMTGFLSEQEYHTLLEFELDCVIHDKFQLNIIESSDQRLQNRCWLKVDTGMHRLGLCPSDLPDVIKRLKKVGITSQQVIAITHLACSIDKSSLMNISQTRSFEEALVDYDFQKSIASSALVLNSPEIHYDWVRVGYMLYGGSPLSDISSAALNLLPAMTLRSQVVAVKRIIAGESVGYGATWVSEHSTYIAVVAIGYGDGYPRSAPEGTPVLINGVIFSLVGRVSMDLITVNLGSETDIKPGDDVVLWGEDLPIDTVAHHCGTIGYELMAQLTSRVERVVI